LGPFATASRRTSPVLILHCHSPGVATDAACASMSTTTSTTPTTTTTRDRGDRYGPMEWAQQHIHGTHLLSEYVQFVFVDSGSARLLRQHRVLWHDIRMEMYHHTDNECCSHVGLSAVTGPMFLHSIAERGGCFRRNLFVCLFFFFVNTITAELLNIE